MDQPKDAAGAPAHSIVRRLRSHAGTLHGPQNNEPSQSQQASLGVSALFSKLYESGLIFPLEDGTYCLHAGVHGGLSSHDLRELADELDRRTNEARRKNLAALVTARLGGDAAMNREDYKACLMSIAAEVGRPFDDAFRKDVRDIVTALPCPLD